MKTKNSMEHRNHLPEVSQDSKGLTRSQSSGSPINSLLPQDYRSISQIITSNLPSIAKIRRSDPQVAKEVVIEFITDLVEFLNVGKIMNVSQIDQTSMYILDYFPHLNLADLRLFFDKMKLGHYGKFYDSVDGQLILAKMDEYNQERMDEFERLRLQQHRDQVKNNPIGEGYHPKVIEAIKVAVGERKPTTSENVKKEQIQANEFHQLCISQFDNLYKKYGLPRSSGRFLKIGETIMSIEQFVNRKFENATNPK